jgi:cytochrome o ubiquinol oxidase subunit IV
MGTRGSSVQAVLWLAVLNFNLMAPAAGQIKTGFTRCLALRIGSAPLAGARDPADGNSFFVTSTGLVWQPSILVALIVLAVTQMGVHLVFFLHITTGPDNTNNVLAPAFGVLIVMLVMGGSLWIMANLNHNMMPMDQLMQMQR